MKNFFKKLSFVLAIAMVLTSLAPATASAASKNYVKANGKKVSTTYAYIGGKTVTLTPYVNGKKATKNVTFENSTPARATINSKGEITALDNGNTIITVKQGKKTVGTVTVKVRTRAKALNIYDKAEYAAGNKTKLTEVTLKVGDKKDLQITMPVYKAAKLAATKGSKVKSTYFTYADSSNEDVVTVTKGNGQRSFSIEAVGAGTAKVTIVANQKTKQNVTADKYYKEASFDVTVTDDKLDAKQTGAQKITVTGTDLSAKAADYTVKRGTVALAIKDVELSEDKATAVLVSATTNIPKGDYTLTFGELTSNFTVEEAVVKEIVIDPEVAVLNANATKAYAYYKVLNQFGEDVTNSTLGTYVTATGSDGAKITDKGTVEFTNANKFTMNLSQVSVALVCSKNGVNATKVLTVGEASKLSKVEFKGVYKLASGKYAAADLKEGMSSLGAYYLAFAGEDQYGRTYDIADDKLTVNLLSTTGLACATSASVDVDGDTVKELMFSLSVASSWTTGKLAAGDVQVMTVCLNNGSQTKDVITVKANVKIDTLTITEKDGVYGGQENELSFEAIDTEGKAVTDFATLKALNNTTNLPQYGTGDGQLRFTRNADGTAKLVYKAGSNGTTVNTPAVITFLSATGKFSTCNISIQPNRVPKAIIGVKDSAVLGAVSGGAFTVKRSDLIIQDQYGNEIKESATAVSSIINTVTISAVVVGANNASITTANAAGADTALVTRAVGNVTETGKTTVNVAIDGVEGSDYKFDVYAVVIDDLTDFKVGDFKYVWKANNRQDIEAPTNDTYGGDVFGYYNGAKVQLLTSDYFIFNSTVNSHTVSTGAISATEGKVDKDGKFTVRINNSLATEVVKEYKYSSKDSEYTFSDTAFQTAFGKIDCASNGAVAVATKLTSVPYAAGAGNAVSIVDQYGDSYTGTVYYTVTGLPTGAEITGNGTAAPSIDFKGVAGEHSLTVKYTLASGVTYTTTIVFDAEQ